jgi:hypothetical protein
MSHRFAGSYPRGSPIEKFAVKIQDSTVVFEKCIFWGEPDEKLVQNGLIGSKVGYERMPYYLLIKIDGQRSRVVFSKCIFSGFVRIVVRNGASVEVTGMETVHSPVISFVVEGGQHGEKSTLTLSDSIVSARSFVCTAKQGGSYTCNNVSVSYSEPEGDSSANAQESAHQKKRRID